jgi:hypothetical protein
MSTAGAGQKFAAASPPMGLRKNCDDFIDLHRDKACLLRLDAGRIAKACFKGPRANTPRRKGCVRAQKVLAAMVDARLHIRFIWLNQRLLQLKRVPPYNWGRSYSVPQKEPCGGPDLSLRAPNSRLSWGRHFPPQRIMARSLCFRRASAVGWGAAFPHWP